MKLKLPSLKLNQAGFDHMTVVVAVFVVVVVGGIGYKMLNSSHADTPNAKITAANICGSGYKKVTGYALRENPSGKSLNAILELYTNASTRTACIFTMSTGDSYGVKRPMYADMVLEQWKSRNDKPTYTDRGEQGSFATVAGPKKIVIPKYPAGGGNHLFIHGWAVSSKNMTIGEYSISNVDFTFKYAETN